MRVTKSRHRQGRGRRAEGGAEGGVEGGADGGPATFQEENEDLGQGQDGRWTDRRALGPAFLLRQLLYRRANKSPGPGEVLEGSWKGPGSSNRQKNNNKKQVLPEKPERGNQLHQKQMKESFFYGRKLCLTGVSNPANYGLLH